jgi:AcrR family transcriptional regulator
MAERADAVRNREVVLEAAIAALSEDADAGMVEIAARSGLGRSTVYRHFPTREALIAGVFDTVAAAERAAVRDALATVGGAADVLRALAVAIVGVGIEYRSVAVHAALRLDDELRHPSAEEPLLVWLTAQAASGRLVATLPPAWMYSVVHGTARAAVEDVQAGRRSVDEARELLGEVLVRAFCVDGS